MLKSNHHSNANQSCGEMSSHSSQNAPIVNLKISVSKEVKKKESFHLVNCNVNQCSHCTKWFRFSYKKS